jgi:hypothetical protein
MTAVLEDLKLALRQICRTIGLEGTAAAVVPVILLGLVLNLVALRATQFLRHGGRAAHHQSAMQNAARTEFKAMRIMLHSTIKKINDSQQRWCVTRQCVKEKQNGITDCHLQVGIVWAAPTPTEGCDIKFLGTATRKRMVAVAQC